MGLWGVAPSQQFAGGANGFGAPEHTPGPKRVLRPGRIATWRWGRLMAGTGSRDASCSTGAIDAGGPVVPDLRSGS